MAKIQRISVDTLRLNFHSPSEDFDAYYQAFLQTDLGLIHQAIPWMELINAFKLTESNRGRRGHFGPQGKLALMFLKQYSGCSDRKLIEQLNGNLHWQFFCGILIRPESPIRDFKLVSKIRGDLARRLHKRGHTIQKELARYWKPYMSQTNVVLTDATCYESSVRYPTDQKLLWECVEWAYTELRAGCKALGIRKPRTKFLRWQLSYQTYSRKRKRRIKERRSLTRGLLRLLEKLLGELDRLEDEHQWQPSPKHQTRRATVDKVFDQQYPYFHHGHKPKDRVVSLSKPYLRPIVRGKEVKSVEFGAKVNKIQIDGINFIQRLDFNAFNEGTCLRSAIFMARRLFGRVDVIGADAIYATNKNRKYCTSQKISTDFKRKGRAGKYEVERKILAKHVRKERATRLEGSFGTEKNHYLLHRIGARTKENEQLWIFMGIHTANALKIGRRMARKKKSKIAA